MVTLISKTLQAGPEYSFKPPYRQSFRNWELEALRFSAFRLPPVSRDYDSTQNHGVQEGLSQSICLGENVDRIYTDVPSAVRIER